MADWANGYDKVTPGKKLYIFTGDSGAAREELISRATEGITHVINVDDLDILTFRYGSLGDTTAFVLRHIEDVTDWRSVDLYLSLKQIKGYSLILSGTHLPEQAKSVKSRTAVRVDVSSPKTEKGQKDMIQWVVENWRITTDVARLACERVNFDVSSLMWATKVFKVFSGDQPVVGHTSRRMVEACTPAYEQDEAYQCLLYKHRLKSIELAKGLNSAQRLGMFRRLEAALSDLQVLHSALSADRLTAKGLSDRTGLHIVRVLELVPIAPWYNPTVVLQCRQALQIGMDNYTHPESSVLVALTWG